MKIVVRLLSVCFILSLTTCTGPQKDVDGFTQYIIEAGNQGINSPISKTINTDEYRFIVKFDSSAIYKTVATENQLDINKLYGFTEDGNTNPHINSARIGWRWYNDELQLFAYCYNNSILQAETLIKKVDLYKEILCAIKLEGNSYLFTVDDTTVSMPRATSATRFEGYKLYPYFGGDESAPHKIIILIKDI